MLMHSGNVTCETLSMLDHPHLHSMRAFSQDFSESHHSSQFKHYESPKCIQSFQILSSTFLDRFLPKNLHVMCQIACSANAFSLSLSCLCQHGMPHILYHRPILGKYRPSALKLVFDICAFSAICTIALNIKLWVNATGFQVRFAG